MGSDYDAERDTAGQGDGDELDLNHEVRTHLAVIALSSGNLNLLYEQLDDVQRQRMIQSICESSQALNDLLHGGYLGY